MGPDGGKTGLDSLHAQHVTLLRLDRTVGRKLGHVNMDIAGRDYSCGGREKGGDNGSELHRDRWTDLLLGGSRVDGLAHSVRTSLSTMQQLIQPER